MDKVFQNAVDRVSTPNFLTTKAEIVDYYKDTYGSKWTGKAAAALSGTTDTKSREYRAAIRQFQGDRLNKEPRQAVVKQEYRQLGEKLPPTGRTPKSNSITVTVQATQSNGRGGSRQREIKATFTGDQAYTWVNDPNFQDIWDEYGFDFSEFDGGEYGLEQVVVS